jgi:hypothetical protein
MNEQSKSSLQPEEKFSVVPITRGALDETLAEDPSFISVREVADWCRECREYKPQILSASSLFAISLGALVGFVPALAATDSDTQAVWWGVFLMGSIIAGAVCILALLAMVVELPTVMTLLHRKQRRSPMERLADVMERASEKGRLRAAAALRSEEENPA